MKDEKRARALERARKREIKAFKQFQAEKQKAAQDRINRIREEQAAEMEEKARSLADRNEKGALLQEFKNQQREILKEREQIRQETRAWRMQNVQNATEQANEILNREFELKGARLEKMERTLLELDKKLHVEHQKQLIEKDQAADELLLRHVTGDWNKSREDLLYPSRCKSVPLPKCAGALDRDQRVDSGAVSALGGFLPPRSTNSQGSERREQTPDEFAASLMREQVSTDNRAGFRMPKQSHPGSRVTTPLLPPLMEQMDEGGAEVRMRMETSNMDVKSVAL